MLTGKGFKKVINVSGGIKAWKSKTAIGPVDLGIHLLDGQDDPLDVLKVAYSLEEGLREFYITMQTEAASDNVKQLFGTLSEIELKHQLSIYHTYNELSGEHIDETDFHRMVETKALEGGLSTREYLDLFQPDLTSETDVISLAMSIEAQALDLYQRVAQRVDNPESRNVINQIANEEKAHLSSLGKLMDSL